MSEEVLKILIMNHYDPMFQISIRVNRYTRDCVKETFDYLRDNIDLIYYNASNKVCIECGGKSIDNKTLCEPCVRFKSVNITKIRSKYPIMKKTNFDKINYYQFSPHSKKYYIKNDIVNYGLVKYTPNMMLPVDMRITEAKKKRIAQIKKLNIDPNSEKYYYCVEQYISSPIGGIKRVKKKIEIYDKIMKIIVKNPIKNQDKILEYIMKDNNTFYESYIKDNDNMEEVLVNFIKKCHEYDCYINKLDDFKKTKLDKLTSIYKDCGVFLVYSNITSNHMINTLEKFFSMIESF